MQAVLSLLVLLLALFSRPSVAPEPPVAPGALEPVVVSTNEPRLVEICAADVCEEPTYDYQDAEGNTVSLPQAVADVLHTYQPGGFSKTWDFSPDGQKLFFLDSDGVSFRIFDVTTQTTQNIFTLRPERKQASLVEVFGWNPAGDRIGIALSFDGGDEQKDKEVFVFDPARTSLVANTFYLPILERCPGNWCELRVTWTADGEVAYQPIGSDVWDLETMDECLTTPGCAMTVTPSSRHPRTE